MKLEKIIIENFRSYKERIEIDFSDLTTVVGKNDIGKSTILEALEIFFNNQTIKIDSKDYNIKNESKEVLIGCVFSDYNNEIILDETVATNLEKEFLLNEDNLLEIHKKYDCSKKTIKAETFLVCHYPDEALDKGKYFIQLTQTDLKATIKNLKIASNLTTNSIMRKDLFDNCDLRVKSTHYIDLKKGESDALWKRLSSELPLFTLFQSDRPSVDGDNEVQDPMKSAVEEALAEVKEDLERIEQIVQQKALSVAENTLEKLKEMDATLADELTPSIPVSPNWKSLFKLSLDTDEGIPVNKRGSGVRRLILLNFFRATAEKRNQANVIYAIEEPETAQHPYNQRLLAESLHKLSERNNTQVILTTHVPNFAGMLPVDSLRLISNENSMKKILSTENSDNVLEEISESLGLYPTGISNEIKVAVFVEGPNDVKFLKNISKIISQNNNEIVDLSENKKVLIIPCGGETLAGWVEDQYLKDLGIPEIHIYDRDIFGDTPPRYQKYCDKVNHRDDGSVAYLTSKREMENYIHIDAIKDYFGIELSKEINLDMYTNVPETIADYTEFAPKTTKKKLNSHVVQRMTYEQIKEIDSENEIEGKWLKYISDKVNNID